MQSLKNIIIISVTTVALLIVAVAFGIVCCWRRKKNSGSSTARDNQPASQFVLPHPDMTEVPDDVLEPTQDNNNPPGTVPQAEVICRGPHEVRDGSSTRCENVFSSHSSLSQEPSVTQIISDRHHLNATQYPELPVSCDSNVVQCENRFSSTSMLSQSPSVQCVTSTDDDIYIDMKNIHSDSSDIPPPKHMPKIHSYVNTDKTQDLHNPDISDSEDYVNQKVWLANKGSHGELDKSPKIDFEKNSSEIQNTVHKSCNMLDETEPPLPKPHLLFGDGGYVNINK